MDTSQRSEDDLFQLIQKKKYLRSTSSVPDLKLMDAKKESIMQQQIEQLHRKFDILSEDLYVMREENNKWHKKTLKYLNYTLCSVSLIGIVAIRLAMHYR